MADAYDSTAAPMKGGLAGSLALALAMAGADNDAIWAALREMDLRYSALLTTFQWLHDPSNSGLENGGQNDVDR